MTDFGDGCAVTDFSISTPFVTLAGIILFRVGILSGRLPICPSGRAITVTRDGCFVVKAAIIKNYVFRYR